MGGVIKVYKQGSGTHQINLNELSDYEQLWIVLRVIFQLEDELYPSLGWGLVYEDNKRDLVVVGHHPWEVFVTTVSAIYILPPAEFFWYK